MLSVFETQEILVLELELMRGGYMLDVLAETGCLAESKAAVLMTELVESIPFFRQQGVAHRDVKLSNLALNAPLTPDNPIEDDELTLVLISGKHEAYSNMVDMFSAGVVLYTILCGYEPFYGLTDKELVPANKTGVFEFHDPEWTLLLADAKDLVLKTMARNKNEGIKPAEALKHPFLREKAQKLKYIR